MEVTVSNACAHYACLLPPEPSSPLGHSLKEEAGDNTAAPPEADTFVRIDVEFKFKASLQACTP